MHHINTLGGLDWGLFTGPAWSQTIQFIKGEIKVLIKLLQRHKHKLAQDSSDKTTALLNPKSSQKGREVVAAFKNSLSLVRLSDNEFHVQIDSAFSKKKKKSPGRVSQFSACIKLAVDELVKGARATEDYDPIHLTDKAMSIDKFGEAVGELLTPTERARYRAAFYEELKGSAKNICLHVFGQLNSGSNPNIIFVWKVPAIHGLQHVGNVARVVTECREAIPKKMGEEAIRHFNTIIDGATNLPTQAREALRNYLFLGDPDPDNSIGDKYVDLILELAGGQVCSLLLLYLLTIYSLP